jgi:hypothetical protein
MALVQPPAWLEPGTASLCLYCTTLLLKGRPGMRLLTRTLKSERDTVRDVALEEIGDYICDHPDILLTVLIVSCSFLGGQGGTQTCCLFSRTPKIIGLQKRFTRLPKTLLGSISNTVISRVTYRLHLSKNVAKVSCTPEPNIQETDKKSNHLQESPKIGPRPSPQLWHTPYNVSTFDCSGNDIRYVTERWPCLRRDDSK